MEIGVATVALAAHVDGKGPGEFEHAGRDLTAFGVELLRWRPCERQLDPWRRRSFGERFGVLGEQFNPVGTLERIRLHALNQKMVVQPS